MKPFNNVAISSEEPTNSADIWIKHCKNMFKTLPKTTTLNGITFTNNEDGTIVVNGTATAVAYIVLGTFIFDDNFYALSGCPKGGGNDKYSIYITNTADWRNIAQDFGEGAVFNNVAGKTGEVRLRIASGVTVNNLIFRPQLEIGERTEFSSFLFDSVWIKEGKEYKQLKQENKNQVEYTLNDTVGWRRIARLGNAISKFYINYSGYGFCCLSLNLANAKGWSKIIEKGLYQYTNGINRFSKIRLLTKGNADAYLDIYNNHNVSQNGKITITIDNNKEISLITEETIVNDDIPDGYSKTEIVLP